MKNIAIKKEKVNGKPLTRPSYLTKIINIIENIITIQKSFQKIYT